MNFKLKIFYFLSVSALIFLISACNEDNKIIDSDNEIQIEFDSNYEDIDAKQESKQVTIESASKKIDENEIKNEKEEKLSSDIHQNSEPKDSLIKTKDEERPVSIEFKQDNSQSQTSKTIENEPVKIFEKEKVSPENVAKEYKKILPKKLTNEKTLTDFRYNYKTGFTYVIKTTETEIQPNEKQYIAENSCENKQIGDLFKRFSKPIIFAFVNNKSGKTISQVYLNQNTCNKILEKSNQSKNTTIKNNQNANKNSTKSTKNNNKPNNKNNNKKNSRKK